MTNQLSASTFWAAIPQLSVGKTQKLLLVKWSLTTANILAGFLWGELELNSSWNRAQKFVVKGNNSEIFSFGTKYFFHFKVKVLNMSLNNIDQCRIIFINKTRTAVFQLYLLSSVHILLYESYLVSLFNTKNSFKNKI